MSYDQGWDWIVEVSKTIKSLEKRVCGLLCTVATQQEEIEDLKIKVQEINDGYM